MGIYKNGIWAQNEFNERLLPDGYTQLEYIESTGTQWIDSNVIMSENISYEAEASIIEQASTSDAAFCGTRDSGDNNTRFVTWWNDYTVTGGRINQSYFTNSDSANYVTEYEKIYKLSMKNKVFSVNNTIQKFFTGTVTNPNNLTFALFGLKYSATTTDSRRFKGRIYWFKIWNNNILVRDFIPALRNNNQMSGLYDLVNDVFYTNAGTGDFKYVLKGIPSDYTQLEYIEGTGTQYINTNYKPYKTTTEIKFQYNSIPSTNGVTLCGVYNDNNNRYYALSYETATGITSSSRTNTKISLLNPADIDIHTLIYNDSNNKVFLDGIEKGTVTNLTTTSTNPLYLFARRGSSSAEVISIGRIYYCKIWEENELVRDFIPVKRKSDDVLGLYDKTNNTFYINNGTGTFIGSDSYAETANVKIYKETNALEANEFWEI